MLTFVDVKKRLENLPEIDLLEILEISSEDIVNRFEDIIEEKLEELAEDFENEYPEDFLQD